MLAIANYLSRSKCRFQYVAENIPLCLPTCFFSFAYLIFTIIICKRFWVYINADLYRQSKYFQKLIRILTTPLTILDLNMANTKHRSVNLFPRRRRKIENSCKLLSKDMFLTEKGRSKKKQTLMQAFWVSEDDRTVDGKRLEVILNTAFYAQSFLCSSKRAVLTLNIRNKYNILKNRIKKKNGIFSRNDSHVAIVLTCVCF